MISSPSTSMKIQIVGEKLLKIWGSNPRSGRSKHVFLFFFSFSNSAQKTVYLWFLPFFWYLVLLLRNQIKHIENVCFYWYLICKTRYSKMVQKKDMHLFMENLKMKRKKDKIFLTFRSRDLNPRFSVIFRPWFEFSCKVRSPRSNQNKLLKEIGL